jgi:hypothetical protein
LEGGKMQNVMKIFLVMISLSILVSGQEGKKVLIEAFLNAHCPLCPPAHTSLDAYNQNSENADNTNFIHYDMVYPYSDDPLYQYNKFDSDGRNAYYNPSGITPIVFFDGIRQANSYNSWGSQLDDLVSGNSPIKITLTGSRSDNSFDINAEVSQSGNISDDDLVIHFVLVENVNYQGRNGVAYHRNVMRKMVTSPTGESFSITEGQTEQVDKTIDIDTENLINENLSVVVFIQSSSSKTVYQSGTITYADLMVTSVDHTNTVPLEYYLEQNYPNPFNPSTQIRYTLPQIAFVKLTVYNLLGKEIETLINKSQQPGLHQYTFNAANLPSGVYFYKLVAVNLAGEETVQTKKMTLIR